MARSKSDFSRLLPEYASPTIVGGALTAVPPFSFHNVTARVFPLAANIASLNTFVDAYINMDVPRSIAYFRPAVPYVYLIMLDYGDMSVDVGKRFMVSQREVSFAIPLQRFKQAEDGTLVFQDFALVHPFLYVDDEWSLETGREVYGWPKVLASMDADVNSWTRDPVGRSKLLSLSAGVYPKAFANQVLEKRTFLEVYAEPAPSYSELPFSAHNALNPVSALESAVTGSLNLAKNFTENLFRLNARGFKPTSSLSVLQQMFGYSLNFAKGILPEALLAQLGGADAASGYSNPKFAVNNVNLKQFRDAENPDLFCYQELNYSVMGADRINRAGLLGDLRMATGDLSGGFRLVLHKYASQPIVDSLGLDVFQMAEADGVSRATLKPILPFWCDMEFHYGRGRPLCWRTAVKPVDGSESGPTWKENRRGDTPVCDERPATAVERIPPVFFSPAELRDQHSALNRGDEKIYNATRGAALEAVPGPFDLPDVTVRVFPLLADRAKLQEVCDNYLNTELVSAGIRFEPFGRYVYFTASNYGKQHGAMWSESNNIGVWRHRAVEFQVPVKWYKTTDGGKSWKFVSVAMIAPFSFANTSTHVASNREINGKRTERAVISAPHGTWMDESGPVTPDTFLNLSAELLPALGLGQKTVHRTLLEVVARDVLPYNDDIGWRFVSEGWGLTLADELRRKYRHRNAHPEHFRNLKALALRLIASGAPIGAPFNEIVLRQCRDSTDPLHACFQSLLLVQSSINAVYDIREIEDNLHVAIHEYPSHPIVKTLGLKVKRVDNRGDSVVQYVQPIRPFWMRIGVKESLAKNITRREGAAWEQPHLEEFPLAKSASAPAPWMEGLRDTLRSVQRFLGPATNPPSASHATVGQKASSSNVASAAAGDGSEHAPQRVREMLEGAPQPMPGEAAATMESIIGNAGDPSPDPVEPQLVLESLLSEEWENWGNPRWYRHENGEPGVFQKPDFCILKSTIASREQQIFVNREGLTEWKHDNAWLVPKTDSAPGDKEAPAND